MLSETLVERYLYPLQIILQICHFVPFYFRLILLLGLGCLLAINAMPAEEDGGEGEEEEEEEGEEEGGEEGEEGGDGEVPGEILVSVSTCFLSRLSE